jgi:hypothetical protein
MEEAKNFGGTLRAWREHMEAKQAVKLAARGESRWTQADAAEYLGVPLTRKTHKLEKKVAKPTV